MTTIAYKDGIIAYDSLAVCGGIVQDNDFNKKIEMDGITAFFCGETGKMNRLIEAYITNEVFSENEIDSDAIALLIDGDEFYRCGFSEGYFIKEPLNPLKSYSIGSGMQFAISAMDFGKDAYNSVKYASTKCIYTGGKIRKYKTKWAK